jgi:hypothetical protein
MSNKQCSLRWHLTRLLLLAAAVFWVGLFAAPRVTWAQSATSGSLGAPKNLVATAVNGNRVDLTWQNTSTNEEGFVIQRASDKLFGRDLASFTTMAQRTNFSDESAKAVSIYYYRVKASTAVVDSDWSNTAIVVTPNLMPKAPSGLTATSSRAFQVNVTWQDNSDSEAGFRIERATDNTFKTNLTSFTSASNVSNCTDNTVPVGLYYYRVLAFNKDHDSPFSNVVSVTVGNKLDDAPVIIGLDTAKVTVGGFTSTPAFEVNRLGVVQNQDVTLSFSDQKGFLDITQGTTILNANKQPLLSLVYAQPNIVAQPPAGEVVLDVFELGPSYSTLNTSINVTRVFEPAALLPGQDPKKDLQVVSWDGTAWQAIAGLIVNSGLNQVSFPATHFCTFALVRPEVKAGPPFTISSLNVFPQYSDPGQAVVIWAEVKDNGPDPGNYNLVLKLNDKLEETRSISLSVLETATVNFNIANQASGSYKIDLNGLTGTMVVRPVATIRPTTARSSAAPAQSSSSISLSSSTAPVESTIAEETPIPISRPLFSDAGFGFLLGGILIVVAGSIFLIFRRR